MTHNENHLAQISRQACNSVNIVQLTAKIDDLNGEGSTQRKQSSRAAVYYKIGVKVMVPMLLCSNAKADCRMGARL